MWSSPWGILWPWPWPWPDWLKKLKTGPCPPHHSPRFVTFVRLCWTHELWITAPTTARCCNGAAVAESTSSAVDVAETETTDHKRIINPSLTRCYSGLFRSFLHCRTCTEDEACSRASCSFAFTNLQLNSLIVHLSGNDVLFSLHSI